MFGTTSTPIFGAQAAPPIFGSTTSSTIPSSHVFGLLSTATVLSAPVWPAATSAQAFGSVTFGAQAVGSVFGAPRSSALFGSSGLNSFGGAASNALISGSNSASTIIQLRPPVMSSETIITSSTRGNNFETNGKADGSKESFASSTVFSSSGSVFGGTYRATTTAGTIAKGFGMTAQNKPLVFGAPSSQFGTLGVAIPGVSPVNVVVAHSTFGTSGAFGGASTVANPFALPLKPAVFGAPLNLFAMEDPKKIEDQKSLVRTTAPAAATSSLFSPGAVLFGKRVELEGSRATQPSTSFGTTNDRSEESGKLIMEAPQTIKISPGAKISPGEFIF